DGTTTDRSTPVRVQGLTDVVAISAGVEQSLALRADGTVWTWGLPLLSSLSGDPAPVAGVGDVVGVAAGGAHDAVLKADGSVWSWGANTAGQLGDGTTTQGAALVRAIDPADPSGYLSG